MERNHCIEAPAWCVSALNEAFGPAGWLDLGALVLGMAPYVLEAMV